MSIETELNDEQRAAMKARDRRTLDVIRQIQTEVSVAKSAPGFSGPVDDDLYRATIASYVRRMDKARDEFEAVGERGRDQVEKLSFEIEYLSRYLPDQPGEDETRDLVRAGIANLGADDPKMTGQVIGAVMRSTPGLDGALVARLVREELEA